MEHQLETFVLNNWTIRVRPPRGKAPFPVLGLIHGWTGDENSMWIFSSKLPEHYLILAVRGLYPAQMGGYGWYPDPVGEWPVFGDFLPAVDALAELLFTDLGQHLGSINEAPKISSAMVHSIKEADFSNLSLLGFSQGAALAYVFALSHPGRIRRLAGLSGFLPEGAESLIGTQPLLGVPVFIAHGNRDDLVPIWRAQRAVSLLQQAGGQVQYCEENVGHKLSLPCFHAMQKFFAMK